ncbi:MAG TPA: hypothetical protein VF450_23180 [Noviherbaspirillum sp.]
MSQEIETRNQTITEVITAKQRRVMNICVVVWILLELITLIAPNLTDYLSFFDPFFFQGVTVRSRCTTGDPIRNARLLMCAWVISFVLTAYVIVKFCSDANFYPEFISRWNAASQTTSIGRKNPMLFHWIYGISLVGGFTGLYYCYMFAGHWGDVACQKFLVDRALFIQGGLIVIDGYFIGLIVAVFYGAMSVRINANKQKSA